MSRLFRTVDPIFSVVMLILLLSGAPFIILGALEASNTRQQVDTFAGARGTVVDNSYIESDAGDSKSGAYYPVVEFKPGDGPVRRFTDGTGNLPPEYTVGTQVDVLYNPDRPEEARLASWMRLWFVPTLLIGIGCLPIGVAAISFIIVRRRINRK